MYKKNCRKYTAEQESEFRFRILDILNEQEEAIDINEIKSQAPMLLGPLSYQKMSRILNYLIEMGLVRKAKHRATNRMVYKSVSKMVEQGYEIEIEENES